MFSRLLAILATSSRTVPVALSVILRQASSMAGTALEVICPPIQSVGSIKHVSRSGLRGGDGRRERRRAATGDHHIELIVVVTGASPRIGNALDHEPRPVPCRGNRRARSQKLSSPHTVLASFGRPPPLRGSRPKTGNIIIPSKTQNGRAHVVQPHLQRVTPGSAAFQPHRGVPSKPGATPIETSHIHSHKNNFNFVLQWFTPALHSSACFQPQRGVPRKPGATPLGKVHLPILQGAPVRAAPRSR